MALFPLAASLAVVGAVDHTHCPPQEMMSERVQPLTSHSWRPMLISVSVSVKPRALLLLLFWIKCVGAREIQSTRKRKRKSNA